MAALKDGQEHSALPWAIYNGWGPAGDGFMRAERIGPQNGGGITVGSEVDMRGSREDFEFIVRCVNSHAALVEALTKVMDVFADIDNHTADLEGIQRMAEAALDLAEAK